MYGDTGNVASRKIDDAVFTALKAAYVDKPSYAKLMEGKPAEFKSEVDAILGNMFSNAVVEPLLSTLMKENDGMEFLSKLQAQTTWATDLDFTAFAVFFQSLVKAHKKWDGGAGVNFVLLKNDSSKTSTEIASFIKLAGVDKWAGLDAEVELLKMTDGSD